MAFTERFFFIKKSKSKIEDFCFLKTGFNKILQKDLVPS